MKTKNLSFLWAAAGGLSVYGLLLLLTALITVKQNDPAAHLSILAAIPWVVGAAATGLLCGWLGSHAAAAGGCFFAVLVILSLFLQEGKPFQNLPLFLLQAVVVMGLSIVLSLPFRKMNSRSFSRKRRIAEMRKKYA